MATEKRLIDANSLIRKICSERDEIEPKTGCDIGYHNGLNMAVSMAINAPTVDAVEVVRCKDCFANGCCSVQIDLDMGDEGYCPKGRKENR